MSSAHFLGQTSPFYSTQSLTLGDKNFLTYGIVDPSGAIILDPSGNVPIPNGSRTLVREFVVPTGYWSYSFNYLITSTGGQDVSNVFIQCGNGLPLPSDTTSPQEIVVQSSYKSNPLSPFAIGNLNGLLWSDGITPCEILVVADTSSQDCIWYSYQNAFSYDVYPSIQFFKCG